MHKSPIATNSVVLYDAQNQQWLHFQQPVQILSTHQLTEVIPLLETLQQQVEQHSYYAAGFVSYEASPAFDSSFQVRDSQGFPLAWFGLYGEPEIIVFEDIPENPRIAPTWEPDICRDRYRTCIHQIKDYIAWGHTYQVNYSFRLRANFEGDPWLYFRQLIQAQEGLYGAFIQLEDWAICCASPELFFQWKNDTLISRPMKGTAPRGLSYKSDRTLAENLRQSPKNQAENVMIVDMIRNDMGRIAKTGSVEVTRLFEIEQYPTLWQMTSLVQCHTQANFTNIFKALFPCASITGAPKPRTMEIIAELENSPRHIYTGTIGFLTPYHTAQFNVAIRTALINLQQNRAEYGVGGGIVWDSQEQGEYEECCTKAKVLTQERSPFSLLETLLWTPENGYFLLDLHLQRLQESAAYFAFSLNLAEIGDRLEEIIQTLPPQPHKIRLLLSKPGEIHLTATPFTPADPTHRVRLGIAQSPIDASNVFLYHKTTQRSVYQQIQQAHPEFEDVLLWNERGELTESCIANLIVEWDGEWYTPPVECGLLAGTMRSRLLQQGKVKEKVIRLENLQHCSRIFLVNSVRQIQEAVLD